MRAAEAAVAAAAAEMAAADVMVVVMDAVAPALVVQGVHSTQ